MGEAFLEQKRTKRTLDEQECDGVKMFHRQILRFEMDTDEIHNGKNCCLEKAKMDFQTWDNGRKYKFQVRVELDENVETITASFSVFISYDHGENFSFSTVHIFGDSNYSDEIGNAFTYR